MSTDSTDRRMGLGRHLVSTPHKTLLDTRKIPTKASISDALIDRKLYRFMEACWEIVEPGSKFIPGWHIGAICDHLEAVSRGDIKRLIINIPPRCCKSLTVGVFWPAWVWAHNPGMKWLFASHQHELAVRDSVKMRTLLRSQWYQERYPHVQIKHDQDTKKLYVNTMAGHRLSIGVDSGVTGEGGDILVVDDPHNAKEAITSEAARANVIEWWDRTMSTRINPGSPVGAKLIIMQRLHGVDLVGHLLRKRELYLKARAQAEAEGIDPDDKELMNVDLSGSLEDFDYDHLCLPAQYMSKHPFISHTKLKYEDPRKVDGELLWEPGLPLSKIKELRKQMGAMGAAGQLDQMPSAEGGGQLKGEWFIKVPAKDWPKDNEFDEQIQSWDLSYSDDPEADYTCGFCMGRIGSNVYIQKRYHRKLAFTNQLKLVRSVHKMHPKHGAIYVEKAATATALHDTLYNEIPGIILESPYGKKETKAWAWSPYLEAGNVHVPEGEAWVEEFIKECEEFPNGANDDQVDAAGIGILRLIQHMTFDPEPDLEGSAPQPWDY